MRYFVPLLLSASASSALAGSPCEFDWQTLGSGIGGSVYATEIFEHNGERLLVVGGTFTVADGAPADYVAAWDGEQWGPLGDGTPYAVLDLHVFDDGSGPELVAGLSMSVPGKDTGVRVVRFDGQNWTAVGGGMNGDVWRSRPLTLAAARN
ncbi:MAG: hypothetical protein ACFHWZ_03405 [Phycisphaerales bacterium]